MSILRRLAVLSMLLPWAAPVRTRPGAAPRPWADAATADLRAIHDLIERNHPGPVDPADPGFRVWLDRGARASRARAAAAATRDDDRTALRDYVNGFADGHPGISFTDAEPMVWPGFLTRRTARAA